MVVEKGATVRLFSAQDLSENTANLVRRRFVMQGGNLDVLDLVVGGGVTSRRATVEGAGSSRVRCYYATGDIQFEGFVDRCVESFDIEETEKALALVEEFPDEIAVELQLALSRS